jgi:hypothetical protein
MIDTVQTKNDHINLSSDEIECEELAEVVTSFSSFLVVIVFDIYYNISDIGNNNK